MKRFLILSLLGVLLGGCVIVPLGYGSRGDGYYQGDGYYHGDDGNRGYGYRDHGG